MCMDRGRTRVFLWDELHPVHLSAGAVGFLMAELTLWWLLWKGGALLSSIFLLQVRTELAS